VETFCAVDSGLGKEGEAIILRCIMESELGFSSLTLSFIRQNEQRRRDLTVALTRHIKIGTTQFREDHR
jgi:hypothetical protein